MPYSTPDQIKRDFPAVKFTDDPTSKVKLSDLPEFIEDADSLIDSYLAPRYVTPVTSPVAVKVLRLYSRSLVADKIKGLLEISAAGSNGAYNQNVRTGLSTKDVISILEGVRDGDSQLIGADLLVSKSISGAIGAGGSQTTRFSRDEDQW